MPHVGVEILTNKLKDLSLSLLPELHIVVYIGAYNGVFFRLPSLTIVESLFRVKKVLKMLHYSSVDLLDVATVCPKSYKEIVDNPEFFSSADVKDLLCSRLKFLSYRHYLVWEICRKRYYKYERDELLKMTLIKSTD